MNLHRSLFVFALLALWLAAGQHCVLEAAGFLEENHGCEHAACCAGDSEEAHERCNLAEADSLATATSIKIHGPQLLGELFVFCLQASAPSVVTASAPAYANEVIARPLAWIPAWNFERRAAPASRAPSLSLA